MIEPVPHPIECRGNVLAHRRPVRTTAIQGNFAWLGKETVIAFSHHAHHFTGESSLEEFEHRADLPRAFSLDRLPDGSLELGDCNGHVVEFRATDNGLDMTGPNLQVAHRPVAHVAPSAG